MPRKKTTAPVAPKFVQITSVRSAVDGPVVCALDEAGDVWLFENADEEEQSVIKKAGQWLKFSFTRVDPVTGDRVTRRDDIV